MKAARAAGTFTLAVGLAFSASTAAIRGSEAAGQPDYHFRLAPLATPSDGILGMLLSVRVNGGPRLRLLVDSGAQELVLNRKGAARSGCNGGTDLDLVGAGGSTPADARLLYADTVGVGDLTLHTIPLLVTDRDLAGIDGVPPLSLFAAFLIRLDIPHRTLDLLRYPPEPAAADAETRTISSNRLMFLTATVDNAYRGYFLLDTGSFYTAISRSVARHLNVPESPARHVRLQGGATVVDAPLVGDMVQLNFGTARLAPGPVIATDLTAASQYHHFEVAGLIGYLALRNSVVVVNYRDGVVRIDPH